MDISSALFLCARLGDDSVSSGAGQHMSLLMHGPSLRLLLSAEVNDHLFMTEQSCYCLCKHGLGLTLSSWMPTEQIVCNYETIDYSSLCYWYFFVHSAGDDGALLLLLLSRITSVKYCHNLPQSTSAEIIENNKTKLNILSPEQTIRKTTCVNECLSY